MRLALAMVAALVASPALGAVSFVGVGTACAIAGTTCTPTINASGAANDIHIAVLHSRTDSAHTCTANCTGWTEFSTQAGDTTGGRLSVWYLRQTGASPPSDPSFGGITLESYVGRIWTFRGAEETGNPWDVLGTNTFYSAPASTPGIVTAEAITTTLSNSMTVAVFSSMDNNTWGAGGGECDTPAASDTSYYTANISSSDNSIAICIDATPTGSARTITAPTHSQDTTGGGVQDPGRFFTFALAEETSGVPATTTTCDMMGMCGER